MNTIIIFGDEDDNEIYMLLKKYFYANCIAISKFELYLSKHPEILLIEKSSLFDIVANNAIIIFKNTCKVNHIHNFLSGFTAVFDSKNSDVKNFLLGRNIRAVSCGLGTSDTLNISGVELGAAVSLQRKLPTLSGEINLPQDIVVKNIGKLYEFSVMAFCAVKLLTGKTDGLNIDLKFFQ